MVDLPSRKDIERISYDILKASKALDVFPTPIQRIVDYSDLVVADNIDVSKIEQSFRGRITNSFFRKLKQIRGILDREEKVIYLDLTQPVKRMNFVKLHEIGHNVLPWQKDIMQYLDSDETLDESTQEEFEAEANYFASSTLFQQDRFLDEVKGLPLSIETSIHLGKYFGSSVHAALRRYVEVSPKRCALLVLEDITPKGTQPFCSVKNFFASKKFENEFGFIEWKLQLGYKWLFVQDYYHGKKMKKDGSITLSTENGEVDFTYHFFNNSYNAFVLFFPFGETQNSKTTFCVSK